jgi:hypothetical protein
MIEGEIEPIVRFHDFFGVIPGRIGGIVELVILIGEGVIVNSGVNGVVVLLELEFQFPGAREAGGQLPDPGFGDDSRY